MSTDTNAVTPSSERFLGRVKWFNNKAGYGFITITDGSRSGSDIFVHHSAVQVENQQYKYLVQGEYVEFNLANTTSGDHEWQATNVNGIKGGKLMCETRFESKLARNTYKSVRTDEPTAEPAREASAPARRPVRARGEGPRADSANDTKDWKLAEKKPRGRPPRKAPSAEASK